MPNETPRQPSLGHALQRIVIIIVGYLTASFAASCAYLIIYGCASLLVNGLAVLPRHWPNDRDMVMVAVATIFFSAVVAVFALPPALAGIVHAELTHARSASFYLSVGTLAGIFAVLQYALLPYFEIVDLGTDPLQLLRTAHVVIVLPAGLAAGFVYWRIARHGAGMTRQPPL